MDRLGPRSCFFAGGLLCALGFLALGFNVHLRADPLWYLGFVSLGVAGPGAIRAATIAAPPPPPSKLRARSGRYLHQLPLARPEAPAHRAARHSVRRLDV